MISDEQKIAQKEIALELTLKLMETKTIGQISLGESDVPNTVNPEQLGKIYQTLYKAVEEA
jgi:hypothetical protein